MMWANTTTMGDLLDQQAEGERADAVALVMPGARLTYAELSARSDQFAAGLLRLGIRKGDRVGILMPNCADFVQALFGIAKLGAIAVPINGRFRSAEATYVIGHAQASVLITADDPNGTAYAGLVQKVLEDSPELRTVQVVDLGASSREGFLSRADFIPTEPDIAEVKRRQTCVRIRDIAVLMYTSGTTAHPKGCLLTHEALVRQGEKVARSRFHMTAEDGFWDPLPLFHCGGIVPMLGTFAVGGKYCHAGFFEAGAALRTIIDEHCTVLYPSFEAIWLPILSHPDFDPERLRHVRIIQNIATPERMEQFEARLPWAKQVTSYGSTECATNLTMGLVEDPADLRLRTLGPPVEGMEVKIVDPSTGEEMPPGEMGELCFRGYSCFEGYYRDPEQTAAAFDDEGFFHSGDRACIESTGHMRYGGRLKDMLKVGGENVAAIEIEDYLARHPAIRIVQVVSVPDARYGEVPAAFVEVQPGEALTAEDVIDFCVGSIAAYKVPRYVRFVTEWPMSGTKVKKFELRDPLVAELTADGIPEAPRRGASRVVA